MESCSEILTYDHMAVIHVGRLPKFGLESTDTEFVLNSIYKLRAIKANSTLLL